MRSFFTGIVLSAFLSVSVVAGEAKPKYFTRSEIETLVAHLSELEYPMTQAEVFSRLGTVGRNLSGAVIFDRRLEAPRSKYYFIHLTDPDAHGLSYVLYLWFSKNQGPTVNSPAEAVRDIDYVEIAATDNRQITYLVQPSNFPNARFTYADRKKRKD